MTLGELLTWIDRSGSLVKIVAGRPVVSLQPGWSLPADVAAALKENRGYFLSLGSAGEATELILDPPLTCEECKRFIHCADLATVFAMCGFVGCPFWQESFGPEWMESARWWFNKNNAARRVAERSAEEGIPE